jgi:hypothetical protein
MGEQKDVEAIAPVGKRKPTPSAIAAAVNGYVRALRLVGHDRVSVDFIAFHLGLDRQQVEVAFSDYRISGGRLGDPATKVSFTRPITTWSRQVVLRPLRQLSRFPKEQA